MSDLDTIENMIEEAELNNNLIGVVNAFGMFRAIGHETEQAANLAIEEFE